MTSRFSHRASYPTPVDTTFTTLVDEAYLTERLDAIGGKDATLLAHARKDEEVAYRIRQGVDAQRLPSAVRSILGGDLVVEREERWRPDGANVVSHSKVTISGVPAEITARSRLVSAGEGCELVTDAEVRVSIPLVGGKIEKVVAEQVTKLLAAEAEFAEKWLAQSG
jgi:uncharacterized protein DUF2505